MRCHCHCSPTLGPSPSEQSTYLPHPAQSIFQQWVSFERLPILPRPYLPKSSNSICLNELPLPLSRLPRRKSTQLSVRKWNCIQGELPHHRGLRFSRACPPFRPVIWACSSTWMPYRDCTTYSPPFSPGFCSLASSSFQEPLPLSKTRQGMATPMQLKAQS